MRSIHEQDQAQKHGNENVPGRHLHRAYKISGNRISDRIVIYVLDKRAQVVSVYAAYIRADSYCKNRGILHYA